MIFADDHAAGQPERERSRLVDGRCLWSTPNPFCCRMLTHPRRVDHK